MNIKYTVLGLLAAGTVLAISQTNSDIIGSCCAPASSKQAVQASINEFPVNASIEVQKQSCDEGSTASVPITSKAISAQCNVTEGSSCETGIEDGIVDEKQKNDDLTSQLLDVTSLSIIPKPTGASCCANK